MQPQSTEFGGDLIEPGAVIITPHDGKLGFSVVLTDDGEGTLAALRITDALVNDIEANGYPSDDNVIFDTVESSNAYGLRDEVERDDVNRQFDILQTAFFADNADISNASDRWKYVIQRMHDEWE
ncbi:hypothetical protein EniLVp02_0079 [Vibrio phage EniLVp02]